MKWASTRQNLSFGFLTKRVSNQPGQLERLAKKIGIFACSKSRCDTRGIWKVLSMVLYLSNRFTNPIVFVIILKSYLSSMLWHKFHEDIIMQTQKIVL